MADISIPLGPIDESPYGAIRPQGSEYQSDAHGAALVEALDGLELGLHDRSVIDWLSERDSATVTTICSWLLRVRNAATEGRIVLDELAELGLTWDDEDPISGDDLLGMEGGRIVIYPRGVDEYAMDADEADEWAAHLAGMARALRAAGGGS